jgi:hypothetical protein
LRISGTSRTESSYDYLTIYDGIGIGGEILFQDNTSGVSSAVAIPTLMSDAFTLVFHSDGSVQYDGFEINVSCEPMPTCARPDSLFIDSVGTDWVALRWVDPVGSAWAVEYGPNGFNPDNLSDTNIHFADFTTTSGTVTGLFAGMKYDFYLMSVCGSAEGDTSWTRMVTTYTACDAISALPYQENFNGLATGSYAEFNPCWSKGANYATDYPYVINDTYAGFSTNFLYFYTSAYNYGDGKQWVVLPAVSDEIDMNTLELSFLAAPCYDYGAGYCHNLLVGVIDTGAYASTVAIDTIAVMNVTVAETKYISFAGYNGNGKNIILLHWLDGNSSTGYLGLDDIDLHLLPQCDRPDSLTLVDVDSSSLSLSWWASDNSTEFYVEWRSVDSTNWQGDLTSTNSIVIDELTPNTLYDVRVRTVCGDDTSMAIADQFRTSCVSISTFPYTEGFETGSYLCWSSRDYNGYEYDNWVLNNDNVHSGANCFYSSYNSSGIGVDWLVSPAIELSDDMEAPTLSWYISGGAYQGTMPHYAVKVSTTSSIDTTTFTTLMEEDRNDYNESTYTYVYNKRSISLAQYAGQTIYVAFVRHARDDNGLYLDDITIENSQVPEIALVGSQAPTVGLAASYIARLEGGQSTGLTWSWRSARAAAGTATMTAVSADTITMLYATAGIDTLRLIGTNAFGADTAYMVVNPVVISYASLPYSTGFEAADDTSWTISNGPNGWYIDTTVHASGSYGLYVSSNNGADCGYDPSSSSHSFAYKAFNFASSGQYGLSFDWMGQGESCCDYVRVYLVPADDNNMVGSNSYSFYAPGTWRQLGDRYNGSNVWQNAGVVFDVDVPGVYYVCFNWSNDGSVGSNPAGAVDNVEIMQITCPAPTNLAFDSITSSSASIHWTPFGSESMWQVQVGNLAPVTVTDTFYTATGLTHATNYSVKVRAICGAGDTSIVLGGSFWTECNAFSVPYYIHFISGNGLNVCWDQIAVGGTTPSTSWSNSSSYSGYEYIYSYAPTMSNPTSDYLISPEIQIPASDTTSLRLVLRMAGVPSSYYSGSVAAYQVLVSPNGADSVAAFTDELLNDTINNSNFTYRRLPLGAYAGQTIRVAIRNISRTSGQVAIYDFGVRYVNEPMYYVTGNSSVYTHDTNIYTAVHEEGDTATMTFSWTSSMAAAGQAAIQNANSDVMQIVYNAAGVDSITFIASNQYGADTTTFHVTAFDCGVVSTFPYTEEFEVDNACWMPVYANGDPSVNPMGVTGTVSSSLPGPHGGNAVFRFSSYSSASDYTQYLISPELGGSNLVLSFWAANYGTNDHLWLGYSTTTRDTAAFTWGSELSLSTTSWTEVVDTLPVGTKYVAFRYYGDYAFYSYIDDLTISGVGVACDQPVVTVSNIGETTVDIHWVGSADQYEVACVPGAWVAPANATVVNNDTAYTFTGLTGLTAYTIGVRAVCGNNIYGQWVTVPVTTLRHPCAVPTDIVVSDETFDGATVSWTAGEAETDWQVRVFCASPVYDNTIDVSGTPSVVITGLANDAVYSVAVRAVCDSAWMSLWSDTVALTPETCPQVTGVSSSNVTFNAATISWNSTDAASYELEYGNTGFQQGSGHTATSNTASFNLTGLEEMTTYDVFVRSVCATGVTSEWSAKYTFTTPENNGIDDVAGSNVTLFPNPASTMVTIRGIEGESTVTVVDLNGREVYRDHTGANGHSGHTSANDNLTIDLTGYAKGAYFVRITGERTTAIRKLIVK